MKGTKLCAIAVFAVFVTSGLLIAFAIEGFKVILIEPSEVGNPPLPQPPENATVISELKSISFDLSLDTHNITVSKGQSMNITVTVYSPEKVNVSLTVGTEDYVPRLALIGLQPELPPGITANLNRTEISLEAGSIVTVNLTLSIESQATSGTYTLQIFAIQKTSHGGASVDVPFQLTIP